MRWIAFLIFVLAAFTATTANGSPVPTAKTRKHVPAARTSHGTKAASHKKPQHPVAHAAARPGRISKRKAQTNHRPGSLVRSTHRRVRTQPAPAGDVAMLDQPVEREPAPKAVSLHQRRVVVMPPPLRGSHESLERQNDKTEADDNLERIQDEDDLADRIARKMLVPVPVSSALAINGSLSENHRYCRPWTANFLADLARAHAAQFHRPLEVSSAVRTVEYQKRLMQTNGNAAPADGDIASPHLTGATIDIAKQGLSQQEMGWMRAHLMRLQQAGKIDVEEEFQQACFHITVYKSYAQPAEAHQTRQPRTGQSTAGHGKSLQPATERDSPPQPTGVAASGR